MLLLIVKLSVAVESQFAAFVPLNVYTPLAVYVVPFHKYELHADCVVDEVVLFLIVKLSVAVESQPAPLVVLNVYTPLAVYVVPFHK